MKKNRLFQCLFSLCFVWFFSLLIATPVNAKTMVLTPTDRSVSIRITDKKGRRCSYNMSVYKDDALVESYDFKCYGNAETTKNIYDLQPSTAYHVVVKDKTNNTSKSWDVSTKADNYYPSFTSKKKAGQFVYNRMIKYQGAQFYWATSSYNYDVHFFDPYGLNPYDIGKFKSAKSGYYSTGLAYKYKVIGQKQSGGKKYLLVDTRYYFEAGLDNQKKVDKKANAFVKKLKGKSKKKKIWMIYKYVAKKTRYSSKTKYHDTAYGSLVKGKATCNGYSQAFAILCEKAGIECTIEHGKVDGERHAWNMVKYKGKWRMCDVTFGDTGGNLKSYFLVKKSSKKYRCRK